MHKFSPTRAAATTTARAGIAAMTVLTLAVALTACVSSHQDSSTDPGSHSSTAMAALAQPEAAKTTSPSFSMTLTVTNNTSYTLQYLRDDSAYKHYGRITSGPSATIAPYGGTDKISYESNNVGGGQIDLIYKPIAEGTSEYEGYFYIPPVGVNTCRSELVGGAPDVVNFACEISHHYTGVTASLTVTDKTTLPIYAFQKTDAPHTQLMEVEGFGTADGTPIDTWQRTISGTSIQDNQQWTFRPDTNAGFGQLISVGTRKCIEVDDATGDIMQRPCSTAGATNQLWKLLPNGDGRDSLQLTLGAGNHWAPGTYYLATTRDSTDVTNATALTLTTTQGDRTSWDAQRQN